MREVIVLALQEKLLLFVDGQKSPLFGERRPVRNEDKTWQRILENINVAPSEITMLVIYEKLDGALLSRIAKFLSDIHTLKLIDLFSLTSSLVALHGVKNFIFCGCLTQTDNQGKRTWEYAEEKINLPEIAPADVFSQIPSIEKLHSSLNECRRNLARNSNKIKSLQKKLS